MSISRSLLPLLALLICAGAGAQMPPLPKGVRPQPHAGVIAWVEGPLALALGARETLEDRGVTLHFVRVLHDDRCPVGARCVRAGAAAIVLEVTAHDGKPQQLTLTVGPHGGIPVVGAGLSFTLLELLPLPSTSAAVRPAPVTAVIQVGPSRMQHPRPAASGSVSGE